MFKRIISFILTAVCLCATSIVAYGQRPAWTQAGERDFLYPPSNYIVGYYSEKYDKKKSLQDQFNILIGYAKSDIIESIIVTVQSTSVLSTVETEKSVSQTLSQRTASFSKTELVGLITETWFDDKNDEVHAMAVVEIERLSEHLKSALSTKQTKVENLLGEAESYKASGKKEAALTSYYECLPLLREIEELNSVITGLRRHNFNKELISLEQTARKGIKEILGGKASTIDEACFLIAEVLNSQLKDKSPIIKVFAPVYEDSKMSSEFSVRVRNSVENKLASKLSVASNVTSNNDDRYNAILVGNYWNDGDAVRLIYTLKDVKTNRVMASAEALVSKNYLQENDITLLPENFTQAGERNKAFAKDEVVAGGLKLELWTNKGDDNLIFEENEEMKVFVRVNRACYLRFIYYLADGTKCLLFDDYFINAENANKILELPETFVCSKPFGIENLQVNAQSKPFDPLKTVEKDGYLVIVEDMGSVSIKTRGFKKSSDQVFKAEKRLTMSTFPSGTMK